MGDPADDWLRANDPQYESSRKLFPDARAAGRDNCPHKGREIPMGDPTQVANMAERGIARWVQPILWRPCKRCGSRFEPSRSDRVFCGRNCQMAYLMAKRREAA